MAKAKYKVTAVSNGGSLTGKVTYSGALPATAVDIIPIRKNPEFCGEGTREVAWIRTNGDALTEAVVFLDKVKEGKDFSAPEDTIEHLAVEGGNTTGLSHDGNYVILMENCRFHPWIRIMKRGSEVVVRNADFISHNIHMRELIGTVKLTMFNFGQPKKGDVVKKLRPRRGNFLKINCEIHNFMFAWALAADNPYAAVVGRDGTYEIRDIPAGNHTVKVWHPTLGVQTVKTDVPAGGAATRDFVFESGKKYKFK